MECFICTTCGVQQAPSARPPRHCPICEDERQYVPRAGQTWTTLQRMVAAGHAIDIREIDTGLTGVGIAPSFGIGQRGLLVQTPHGNVLWDCVGFIDEAAIAVIRARGGIQAIAVSHPHFYGTMVEWSRAFDHAPIYVPSADSTWVQRPDDAIVHWDERVEILPDVTLVQCGGHFEGSAVLHWAEGGRGRGALLVGDTLTVVPDTRFVSFMRSYPNHIPLAPGTVRRIVATVRRYRFDVIYGGWWDRTVTRDGARAVERSASRYLRWMGADDQP